MQRGDYWMSTAELLAMMTPKGVKVDHIPGGIPKLTGIDVAGACGMAKLSGPEYRLMLAKYCGDADSLRELEYDVWSRTADLAVANGWKPVRGKPYLRTLAITAIGEVISDHRCHKCNGTGLNMKLRACHACGGTGIENIPGGADVERLYGISADAWKKTWQHRFPLVVDELRRWEGVAIGKITRSIRG